MGSELMAGLVRTAKNYEENKTAFNELLEKRLPRPDEIDAISKGIRNSVDEFRHYSEQMKQRLDELKNRKFCYLPVSQSLFEITALSIFRVALTVTGAFLAIYQESHHSFKWVGFGFIMGAGTLDIGGTALGFKYSMQNTEFSELQLFNDKIIATAVLYSLFIEKLRDVIIIYSKMQQNNHDMSNHIVVEMGSRIKECLDCYKQLPRDEQKIVTNCRIVSAFLSMLGTTDPLYNKFAELEPESEKLGDAAERKLSVDYLLPANPDMNTESKEGSPNNRIRKWSVVEEARPPLIRTGSGPINLFLDEPPSSKYAYSVFNLIKEFKTRFGLSDETEIPYLFTPNGFQIRPDPEHPVVKLSAETFGKAPASSEPSNTQMPQDSKATSDKDESIINGVFASIGAVLESASRSINKNKTDPEFKYSDADELPV